MEEVSLNFYKMINWTHHTFFIENQQYIKNYMLKDTISQKFIYYFIELFKSYKIIII